LDPIEVHYMEKNPGMFSSKTLISFRLKKERHGPLKPWLTRLAFPSPYINACCTSLKTYRNGNKS